ncbi:MAG: Hsp20/alpha crystallin family protein [Rhodospirillales bacterium]|nr:Hsp20/alpha crystallin family protein [Rhodospirillales bacterium]MDE2576111.1 Hsp20/alpha crystallin family protein [Rhodospirillales bacterium]
MGWDARARRIVNLPEEEICAMSSTPVPVQKTIPAAAGTVDIWQSFRTEMDRLFDRFTLGFGMTPHSLSPLQASFGVAAPAVDIVEDDAGLKITAELPGMTERDIEVSLSGGRLTLKGEKRQEREETAKDYYLSERSYGRFQRSFLLPDDVEADKLEASFANGVLTVSVPKVARPATKKIEVKAA